MALINLESARGRAVAALEKMAPTQGIELLTYKRNRGVSLFKLEDGRIEVTERGYHEERWVIEVKDLPKLLKIITKREFPRSRKVRFYHLAAPSDVGRPRKKL